MRDIIACFAMTMADGERLKQNDAEQRQIGLKEFLEQVAPGSELKSISSLVIAPSNTVRALLNLPVLSLHCDHCGGVRSFQPLDTRMVVGVPWTNAFVRYTCRNCQITKKVYALRIWRSGDVDADLTGRVYKYGEYPPFGVTTPARVIKLLGPDRDYYLKGRRAEKQGMGIGAFAYYRRVVENQKNRLIDEIIRVAEKIGAAKAMVDDLNHAKNEDQFSTSVEAVKHGIPEALLVNGHNPLTLLHRALSEGIHAQSDEKCLEMAASIRTVLTDLADRLAHALKDRAELNAALKNLMR